MTAPAAAVRALQLALAGENAAVFGYGVAGAHLSGASRALAQRDWVAHQVARDALTARLESLGARPAPAAAGYQLPFPVHDARAAVRLVISLEDRLATAYLAVVALPEPGLRALGAQGVRSAALRAAAWRGVTVAFPGLSPS
jgi:hypothetical protein